MPGVTMISSSAELSTAAAGRLAVAHFSAAWAPQCRQLAEVLQQLASEPQMAGVQFVQLEAEEVPELALKHAIAAVPTCILFSGGAAVDRVDGAKAAELTQKVRQRAELATLVAEPAATSGEQEEELTRRLRQLVSGRRCMLFMKGTPEEPKCGFSRQIIELFREQRVLFSSFNILEDDEVRQGLKKFSDWPTYPQVYVDGELVGGLDIIKELAASGELTSMLPCQLSQEEMDKRLRTLTTSAPVMVFMKGSCEQPACGFSRQLVEILNSAAVKYSTFNILTDEEVRQQLKRFADFPTYPQLWVNGELVGGLDIVKELREAGELEDTLKV